VAFPRIAAYAATTKDNSTDARGKRKGGGALVSPFGPYPGRFEILFPKWGAEKMPGVRKVGVGKTPKKVTEIYPRCSRTLEVIQELPPNCVRDRGGH